MSEVVRYETREGVALITVTNPPVNALIQPVRAGIDDALARAVEDADVGAIVLRAEGRTFPAGTDVRDFHREADRPRLGEVCARIEAAPKPVIAAIHGTALGGGLELALACHYRLALAGSQFGLPDVMLGVVPVAGGTQRLPRLIGPARALEMLLSGRPVKAKPAERFGLIDKMIRKNLDRAAFGTARNMAREGQPPRPTRAVAAGLRDPEAYLGIVAGRRSALENDPQVAPAKVVRLVEAALLLPFDAGLAMERAIYDDLVDSPQASGLRHAFLAERRGARARHKAVAAAREIDHVAVIGQGTAAASLARTCLAGGLPVLLAEAEEPARLALRARIVADYGDDVQAGRLAGAERDAELERLKTAGTLEDLGAGGVVIATGDGSGTLRADVSRAGAETPPGTVLAIAVGGADLADMARAAGRPGDVLGLFMPSPAHHTRLLEVAASAEASADLAATGIAFAQRTGKVPVTVEDDLVGRLTGALDGALFAAAEVLALTGTDPAAFDAALRAAGMPLGPFERADRGWLQPSDPPGGDSRLLARMRDAGWTGQAAGQGFYRYDADGALFAAAEVLALTGTDPAAVDAALRAAGMPLGPFERADRGWLQPSDPPGGDSRLLARMRDAGWTGQAAGQGFYRYDADGARLGTSPEVLGLLGALREASRVPASISPPEAGEIQRRCLLAMANAGARLVAEGAVACPADVDLAAIHGLGLARWLGGPMQAADQIGLLHARNLMRGWAGSGDLSMAVWTPEPLFDTLLRTGRDFGDLNE